MRSTFDPSSTTAERAAAEAYRSHWGRLLSVLVVRTRRLDLAEDALAEAFSRATSRWPLDGVPDNPSAWLYVTARRVMLGRLRSEAVAGRVAPLLTVRGPTWSHSSVEEHDNALPDEIARLFLVQTSTMAARLTRAKRKIAATGIPLVLPVDAELTVRLDAVTRTISLAFTAAYAPGTGTELLRTEEAGDAVRLAATLHELVPDAPQVKALLALLLFQHARRDARVRDGELITLANQDRDLWRRSEIDSAVRLLDSIRATTGYAEELRLQALAAREHAIAATSVETNWAVIAANYAELERCTGSPIVRLNRAVAVAEVSGPRAGLAGLAGLEIVLDQHHRYHAVRADLERRCRNYVTARAAYMRALELCGNDTERSFLRRQLRELGY
jgi:RNA polymerase sigma-70 factor, ECF subfamily